MLRRFVSLQSLALSVLFYISMGPLVVPDIDQSDRCYYLLPEADRRSGILKFEQTYSQKLAESDRRQFRFPAQVTVSGSRGQLFRRQAAYKWSRPQKDADSDSPSTPASTPTPLFRAAVSFH